MKPKTARGFTFVEVMIVGAIIALLAAIAIPNVLRARSSANETTAVGNLRALVSSMAVAFTINGAYPTSVESWNAFMPSPPAVAPAPFTAMPQTVQGYLYEYVPGTTPFEYAYSATPSSAAVGSRSFFVDESGIIRHCIGSAAEASDKPLIQSPDLC